MAGESPRYHTVISADRPTDNGCLHLHYQLRAEPVCVVMLIKLHGRARPYVTQRATE